MHVILTGFVICQWAGCATAPLLCHSRVQQAMERSAFGSGRSGGGVHEQLRKDAAARGRSERQDREDNRGRRTEGSRSAQEQRQAAGQGEDRRPHRQGLRIPGAESAGRLRDVRRGGGACQRHRDGHRQCGWPSVRHRGQRCDCQGRHLLPNHSQETSQSPGHC